MCKKYNCKLKSKPKPQVNFSDQIRSLSVFIVHVVAIVNYFPCVILISGTIGKVLIWLE